MRLCFERNSSECIPPRPHRENPCGSLANSHSTSGSLRFPPVLPFSMKQPPTLPLGFRTAGHACGIKSDPSKLDLALFAADQPAVAAGVFTQNQVVGAPVTVSRARVPSATTRAVVINSGCANACTGNRGIDDAERMTALVAEQLGCAPNDVLVCSTGVIGHFLPMDKIAGGIPAATTKLQASPDAFLAAAQSMMTTDTVPKQATRQIDIDGKRVTISGACKGAAMIGSQHGNDAGRRDDRRATRAGSGVNFAEGRRGSQLQLHQRRSAHEHQRHRPAAGQRRGRNRSGRVARIRPGSGGCVPTLRSRSFATPKGQHTS